MNLVAVVSEMINRVGDWDNGSKSNGEAATSITARQGVGYLPETGGRK